MADQWREIIDQIAEVSEGVGHQANVGAMELAGQIVSVLHANPEHVERFMAEGAELFIDGTFLPENGSLSYLAMNGKVTTPAMLRQEKGKQQ